MKTKLKKYNVVIITEIEAKNITDAGIKLCDLSIMAGCKVKGLYIRQVMVKGHEKE